MGSRFWPALVALVAVACATATPLPAPPAAPVADLRGAWAGTWGGRPASLLIAEQTDSAGYSGIYLGNVQVLGHDRPGVSGILTSSINGEQTSVHARGWFGSSNGQELLVLRAESPSGSQRMTLRRDGPDRLVGTGDSSFGWGPAGPIELTRRAPAR
jgi:hypothetical protein